MPLFVVWFTWALPTGAHLWANVYLARTSPLSRPHKVVRRLLSHFGWRRTDRTASRAIRPDKRPVCGRPADETGRPVLAGAGKWPLHWAGPHGRGFYGVTASSYHLGKFILSHGYQVTRILLSDDELLGGGGVIMISSRSPLSRVAPAARGALLRASCVSRRATS